MTSTADPTGAPAAAGLRDIARVRHHMLHVREFLPTRRVWRGDRAPRALSRAEQDLDGMPLSFEGWSGSLSEFLAEFHSDAVLVLHRGAVVHERYLHGMVPHDVHVTASMSKSLVGLVAVSLIRDGLLARDRALHTYVPELAGTAFGDATVQDLLHMGTQVSFGGRPFVKEAEARRYFAAVGILPRPVGYDGPTNILEHLATARADGPSGTTFQYDNGNTEAIAEAIRRVTGATVSALISDLLWSRIGAAEDGQFALDRTGREIACGQFGATLADLARLGEMLRCGGAVGSEQVLPEDLVAGLAAVPAGPAADVLGTGDVRGPDGRAVVGYHDFWWVPAGQAGAFAARGRSGQRLYVSPSQETVVAHFGSQPVGPEHLAPPYERVFAQLAAQLG